MKISIITPTFNSEENIKKNLKSVLDQDYDNWEQIIIDNDSNDNTLEIIKKINCHKTKIISESDNGVYDALNKGIKNATGDLVFVLHSDDYFFSNNILTEVIHLFKIKNPDIVYGNLLYVDKKHEPLRFWKSGMYESNLFFKGWSPPHPTFVTKKINYKKYGMYNSDFGNSADIELMYRFLNTHKLSSIFLDKTFICMKYGGISNKNVLSILRQNIIVLKILRIHLNIFKITKFFFFKLINRVKQFIDAKKLNSKKSKNYYR